MYAKNYQPCLRRFKDKMKNVRWHSFFGPRCRHSAPNTRTLFKGALNLREIYNLWKFGMIGSSILSVVLRYPFQCMRKYKKIHDFWPCNLVKCGIWLRDVCMYVRLVLSHSWSTPKQFKISEYAYTTPQIDSSTCLRPNFAILNLGVHPERGYKTSPPVDSENMTNSPQYVGSGAI